MTIDISKISGSDLITLGVVLGVLVIVFALTLYVQRKHLLFLKKPPQFKIDAERHEEIIKEARKINAETKERFEEALKKGSNRGTGRPHQ